MSCDDASSLTSRAHIAPTSDDVPYARGSAAALDTTRRLTDSLGVFFLSRAPSWSALRYCVVRELPTWWGLLFIAGAAVFLGFIVQTERVLLTLPLWVARMTFGYAPLRTHERRATARPDRTRRAAMMGTPGAQREVMAQLVGRRRCCRSIARTSAPPLPW